MVALSFLILTSPSRTKYRLCEVFMPTARQSFYMPDPGYEKILDTISTTISTSPTSINVVEAGEGSNMSQPNDFEREIIFCGALPPPCPTPTRSPSPQNPISPPPQPVSRTSSPISSLSPPHPEHWIMNPKLAGIRIKVDIDGGDLDTSKKKDGIYVTVEAVAGTEGGLNVLYRRSPTKVIPVPYQLIQSFHERPNPAREKGLMVVARNHPEHIGKLVRRVHHFYKKEKTEENHWLMVLTVDRSGPKEQKGFEWLEFHPNDLEYVQESAAERKYSTELFHETRIDFQYNPVEIRVGARLQIVQPFF